MYLLPSCVGIMMGKQIKSCRYLSYVVSFLVCLRMSYSQANVLPVPVVEDRGIDLDLNVNLNAADSGRSQSQLLNAHADPPNILPAKPSSPDEVNAGVKSVAAGSVPSVGPLEDGKAETGNANDLKPTKDDWYYNPADEEENGEAWDDEDSYKDEDLDSSVSTVPHGVASEGDDEDDDEDEANYEIWAKPQNNDKEQDDVEGERGEDGARLDQDFDEKLLDDVVDEDLVKKNKPPTAPSKMVLFYTWMILAILIMVISISTYQARCRGLHEIEVLSNVALDLHLTKDEGNGVKSPNRKPGSKTLEFV